MRKFIGVTLLITALACPAYAGDIPNGAPTGTPPSTPAGMQNEASGEMTNDANGDMPNGVNATSNIQGAEFALSLLQSVLSLF